MTIPIAILGVTGVVGQKLISLLHNDSRFTIAELAASSSKIGQSFDKACDWREVLCTMPQNIVTKKLCDPRKISSPIVLSCLPGEIAAELEQYLVNQGKIVFSNASSSRMSSNVPLLVPEINKHHLSLIEEQKTEGKIITNPNCSAVGIALSLAPLKKIAKFSYISIVTLQSISGAGYPGISAMDIVNNTIPHINDEAKKITIELKKILGEKHQLFQCPITTSVHRVPVMYGHTATIHLTFENDVSVDDIKNAYNSWNIKYNNLFIIHEKLGKPQAKDLAHDDMSVHIGHIEQGDKNNTISITILTHNLVRGAAGAIITNMEAYLGIYGYAC